MTRGKAGLAIRPRSAQAVGAGARRRACWGVQGGRRAGGRQVLGAGGRAGRWARARAGRVGANGRERARGRRGPARSGTARRGARVSAGTQQPGAATRPALATTLPGQGPRYGHCARTWACLGAQLGQLGAYAPDSVFQPGF